MTSRPRAPASPSSPSSPSAPSPPPASHPATRSKSPSALFHSSHGHDPLSPPDHNHNREGAGSPTPKSPSLAPAIYPTAGDEIEYELELERAETRATMRSETELEAPTSSTVTAVNGDGGDAEAQRERDVYDRFSPGRKRIMIAIVSFSGFLGPVASSAFLPSINVMADELNTTPEVINYTVAIFIVTIGIAPLFWSPLAGFYGRRPIYLLSMPIMTVASVGVANSHNIGQLIGTRILQGIGCSCVLSVGAGTVGDLYRPTERANAMSWFYSGVIMGPAFSPVLAGIFTQYTPITWRATQYFLCAASALSVALTAIFLPETSHPPLPHDRIRQERGEKFVPYWFNPVRSVYLMRYINIAVVTLTSCLVMVELYCIMIPLSTIFKVRYHLDNVALAGCIYLAHGAGTLLSARITGPYADYIVRKWMEKRGYRKPEDRLRAAWYGTALILPLSCFAYGWLLYFDKGGMGPPIVFLFINGIGTQMFFTPINTYLVDAMQKRSAEAIAVNNFFRYLFGAAASAFVLPMINGIGLGWTMTIGAICCWLGFALILVVMKWGEGWRMQAAAQAKEQQSADIQPPVSEEQAPVDEKAAHAEDEVKLEEQDKGKEKSHLRKESHASDHEHHEERAHGEPSHLPTTIRRQRARANTAGQGAGAGLARASSRHSTKTLPTAGEVLERTVSISGASVHGG